jgi:lipid-binding SYLF domain-containing protein
MVDATRTNGARGALLLACCSLLACYREPTAPAEASGADRGRAVEELSDAAVVLREMSQNSPIPLAQREKARCVAVVPSMLRVGLVIGGEHGHGVVTCRTTPGWSSPAFITLAGGSAGLQAGVESADLVMLVMSERAVGRLFQASFQLGADAAVAAGPVGESAQASTDATMTAEILSYARSRGLFAGVDVKGLVMKQDRAASAALYGRRTEVREILVGNAPPVSEAASFLEQVRLTFLSGQVSSTQRVESRL